MWALKNVGKCWKMLESAACAFGWINPLLGQMAPSPCRADKPQSAHHPSCICVFVCANTKKKKRSTGILLWQRWLMDLFWSWFVTGSLLHPPTPHNLPPLHRPHRPFLCVHVHTVCFFLENLKIIHVDMLQYLPGICGLTGKSDMRACLLWSFRENATVIASAQQLGPWMLPDFQGRAIIHIVFAMIIYQLHAMLGHLFQPDRCYSKPNPVNPVSQPNVINFIKKRCLPGYTRNIQYDCIVFIHMLNVCYLH